MAEDNTRYIPQERLLTQREGNYGELTPEDYETSWSDYGRALGSGAAGVVSGLAGGTEYLTGGALGGDTRRYFSEISEEQIKAMTPVGRRAIQAEFLPEEGGVSVLENTMSSLGLKTVSAIPSLAASIIPASIAVRALQGASLGTRVFAAGAATRGTAGAMAGGDVAGQIYSEVEKLSDKDLQEKSDLYAGYRSMMPEDEARRKFMQDVAGVAPATAALISAAIGGAEGQAAGRLAGKAATGVIRGIGQGARAEAAQETAESGVGELLAQLALTDENLAQMNWQKILSKGLEGATIGGIMGGGVGGISGMGRRADAGTLTGTSDPEAIERLMKAEQAPETESQGVVPPKGYGTGTAPAPAEDPNAGNPQSAPSGSETQYPKGKAAPFTIDTVRSRLQAKGIEFPEERLQEVEDRISEIRNMKVGKRGAEYGALLRSLYPAETTVVAQTIAPGLQVGEGMDPAQLAAVQAANPVQPVAAPQPSAMAPTTPPPVATAYENLTSPRAPAPAQAAPSQAPAPIPAPVAAAVQKQTAAPVDTGTNLQQPAADLLAEQRELVSGQRAVQMFPSNTTPLELPKGMKEVVTPRGVFHYNPKAKINGKVVNKGVIQRLSAKGKENELLGLGDRTKQEVAAAAPVEGGVTTVNEVTPAGETVRSVAATVADADRQAQMLGENAAPENKIEIKPIEQALAPRVSQDVTYKGRNVVEDLVQKQREEEEIARRNAELDRLERASEARRQDKVAKDASDKELQVDEPRFLTRMRKIKKALGENAPEGVDKAIQLANQRKALGSGKSQKKIDITKQIRALQKIELEQRTIAQPSSEGTANVPAITRGTQVAEAPKPKKLGRPKKNPVAGTEEESAEAEIARLIREQKQEQEYDRKGVDKRALGSGGMREEETQREISDERDAGGTIGEDEAGRDTQEAFDIEPSVEVSNVGYGGEQAGRALSAAEEKAFEDRIKKNGQLINKIQALLDDAAATEGQKAVARVQLRRLKQERNDLMQEREETASSVEIKKADEERQARLAKAREEGYEPVAPTKAARVVEVSKKRAPIKGKLDLKPKAAAAVSVAQKGLRTYETGKPFVANVYHGTGAVFDKFQKVALGRNTGAKSAREAFFFSEGTETPNAYIENVFEKYSSGEDGLRQIIDDSASALRSTSTSPPTNLGNVGMVIRSLGNERRPELIGDYFGALSYLEESIGLDGVTYSDGQMKAAAYMRDIINSLEYSPRVVLARIKMNNPLVFDFKGEDRGDNQYSSLIKRAKAAGHDGVVMLNTVDGGPVDNVFAVFDENQISDKFLPGRPEGQLFPSMPTGQRARARISAAPTGPSASMAGVDFTPIQSTNVSRSMKMVSDEFYKMFRSGPDRLFATFFKNKLTQRVGNVPVHIATPEDMQSIYFKATGKVGVPNGLYHNGVIALNVNTVADPIAGLEVAMHEALHAWSENAINSNPGLQRALDIMVARGLSEHQLAQYLEGQEADRSSPYGLTDRYEFISESFSSPNFRSFLSSVELSNADRMLIEREIGPVKGPFKTALDAFLQLLRSAMGLPDTLGNYTLLDAVMRAGAKIDAIVEQQGTGLDVSAPARANITAQGIIDSSVDRKNAYTSWVKRNWAKFITGGQMRQQYADTVIGPALAKIWEGVSATGPRIQQIKAGGDALATRAIDLSKKNPTEFRSLVQIMEEARMMNVNIEGANTHLGKDATKGWQAKGRLGDLQSRFAQIRDGELKQLYRDMAAYYRDSHNAIVKSSVTSILEGLELRQARGKAKGNALSEQQIADLTKRVMDQEMTAADKALLGVTVFNALKNAAAFHRIQGDYFPLMRYGDHVVVTTDKIKDTMGGKLEEPDTVLFRDKSNTTARRAAENFVKKSDLVHLSTEKVFIDNATGKEVSEDDAKSLNDVDVGYRVTMQTKGVYFFESGTAAEEFARTNPEGHDTVSNPEMRMGSGYQAQIMTGTQVASLNSAIDGRVKTGDITEGQAALLKSIVNQAATRMLGGNRIASRRLKSQKVTGASSDVARNLLQYNSAAANHIAVAENAPAIRDGLTEMTEALKGYAGNDRAQLVAVAEEVKARVDQGIVDPNAPGKVMKDIMALSFLARLFSPAYNVINAMQPWMVTLPVLGGRFGYVATSAAMGRAYSDIGLGDAALQGVMNTARATKQAFKASLLGTDDVVGNIRKKITKADDGADLTRMMDELIRQNAIDVTAGFEVAASAAEGRGTYGKTLAGVDRIARQLPQVVEAVNRSMSAIVAYRLARSDGQTHEQATQFALNTVQNTQGDYSAANAPRFFNNPILRPALQFKKYAQMMTYLLGDMAYRAFNGATPEERRVALKQIGGILGVQILVAGALSLPGLEIIKAGFLIASMLGIGGGWDEVEEKLRKLLDDSVGKKWSEMISSGILSRAIGNGIDVSQRMSLADMWLFGEPKGDSAENIQAYLFRQVVGAPGSLLLDARDGFAMALEGEWGKAAGKLIPIKFAADFAKAAHNVSESQYEKPEKKKVSGPGEFALNVLGFRTGRQAELGRTIGANVKERQDKQKEFKKLQKAFYNARTKGDQIKAIARNREWNDSLSQSEWRLRLPVTPRELRTAQ